MTAWCLDVIAELALSPQCRIIDGIHPLSLTKQPDEFVSFRRPELKDP